MPNHPVDRVSKGWLACYPRRTFYSLSDNLFHSESPDHYNRLSSLFDLSILQSSKHILLHLKVGIEQLKLTFAHLRYFLGGDRPSQTTFYTMSFIKLVIKKFKSGISTMFKQFTESKYLLTTSHLFYTKKFLLQYINIVKVHGVFPSSRKYSASSRKFQFHWVYVGDSGTVVTPFMQDTN